MPFWNRRPKERQTEVDDAAAQKRRIAVLSREMATHASMVMARALELKEKIEHDAAR